MGNQSSRGRIFVQHQFEITLPLWTDTTKTAYATWDDVVARTTTARALSRKHGSGPKQRRYTPRRAADGERTVRGGDPAVTIASQGSAYGTISRSLIDARMPGHRCWHTALRSLGSHAAAALHRIARHIDCSRRDAGTAAYLLQDWMDQL
jgi:hypothetical protein